MGNTTTIDHQHSGESMMNYAWKVEQLNFWQQHGYVVLADFLQPSIKERLPLWCDQVTRWPEIPGRWMKYYELNTDGERQLCRIENFLDYHPDFDALIRGQRCLQLVADLMNEKASIFKEKINYKFPRASGFKPHQDAPAFVTFKQTFHITMMIAIDDCTVQNGCLHVLKENFSRRDILPQESDGSIRADIVNEYEWQALECHRGDVVLFHSYLPHYSEANCSQKARRVLFATYNKFAEGGSLREAYFKDKRKHFPPDCERDPRKDYSKGATIYNVANPIKHPGS